MAQNVKNNAFRLIETWLENRIVAIWQNLLKNHLWQRILKNTVATTLAVILGFIPAVAAVLGTASYLAPIVTVFGHPGRRFGMMAEALVLCLIGVLVGVAWSTLGIYLSSLIYDYNSAAAYTIKGLFLAIALMFHGYLRSHTPRLFIFVLLLVIVAVVALTGTSTSVTGALAKTLLYPILSAIAILLVVNVSIFPEFSSSFLGITTIETLVDTVAALRDAGLYFVETYGETAVELDTVQTSTRLPDKTIVEKSTDDSADSFRLSRSQSGFFARIWQRVHPRPAKKDKMSSEKVAVRLSTLTATKGQLRAKLGTCKAVQAECAFELAFAVLPPRDLKTISDTLMKKLVANTIALIGSCESKYALIGDSSDLDEQGIVRSQLETRAQVAGLHLPDDSTGASTPADVKAEDKSSSNSSTPVHRQSIFHTKIRLRDGNILEHKQKRTEKKQKSKAQTRVAYELQNLELVKPRKEIEFGDVHLLSYLIKKIERPIRDLQNSIDETINVVKACLAYCYDVERLPSGEIPPKGVTLEELDIRADYLTNAIDLFDNDSSSALEQVAALKDTAGCRIDIMPRMEVFLVSSFLLNLRQAARHTKEMLDHTRIIVEKRQNRHERRRVYAPRIQWKKWLRTGGEEDKNALPEQGRKDRREGKMDYTEANNSPAASSITLVTSARDEETPADPSSMTERHNENRPTKPLPPRSQNDRKAASTSMLDRFRNSLADIIEFLHNSDDILYAFKLTLAVFIVVWPAFIGNWNQWYSLNRGLWAALQLVLITENSIGNSVYIFLLRAAGTSVGCLWGYGAYASRNGNPYSAVVILVIGVIVSSYVQLGSQYIKAGMVSIISMCIVALATELNTVPGTVTENFLKRFIAFLIGGIVALVVEVVILPVRARTRLVESLASSIQQINEMESCLAYGIESEVNVDPRNAALVARFDTAKAQAEVALTAATTFLPFCAREPRIKGSFAGLSLVYSEILYVLHQIVDKMDNMLVLRREYGSGVLEEFNAQVYAYRRNVAGSITLSLFAVHEALTTKLPLPQFLPSARLAHLRMVNRVREIVSQHGHRFEDEQPQTISAQYNNSNSVDGANVPIWNKTLVKNIVRQKFLSWNAASAGQIEVIEYLEELIDLTKLLVGANEFRSGLLTRPSYREYVAQTGHRQLEGDIASGNDQAKDESLVNREREELEDEIGEMPVRRTTTRKMTGTMVGSETALKRVNTKEGSVEGLPLSLQRVRSRRLEQSRSWDDRGRTSAKGKEKIV